jgi:NYN domain
MEKTTYVFIDGGYVREAQNKAMLAVFGVPGESAPEEIGPSNAFRFYFYDCLDDLKREDETEEERDARVSLQRESLLSRRHRRPGLHVQLGVIKGGKRRSQKEVDVLLAVDMMTHAFNKNMTHAVLISGDLDFRPVVEALVRSGVFVDVWYEKSTAAKDLPGAADFGSEVNWHMLYGWNTQSFREKYRPPSQSRDHRDLGGQADSIAVGKFETNYVEMMRYFHGPHLLMAHMPEGMHWFEHPEGSGALRLGQPPLRLRPGL